MLYKDSVTSEDALVGNRAYDLASLIDDVRLKTSKALKKKIFNYYLFFVITLPSVSYSKPSFSNN